MTSDEQAPSKVVPVLVATLVCDVAVVDPSSGKKTLVGIFNRISVGHFPTERPMSMYFKVTDAEGYYKFDIRYVQVGTGKILAGAQGDLQAKSRLDSYDMCIQFPPLPVPEAGRYDFQVWMNSMFLGSTFMDAVQR